ncbi:MAG TPA: Hsp20/alpha crystallin family protein [Chloroflexota bacterium]|nr:Hsp20/alpha crystallin family protein [Chloroflexota bacterium]
MAAMMRWDPFGDMVSLRDAMNDLLEQSMVRPTGTFGRLLSAPMDVYAEGDNYIVEVALPGVKPDSVDVSVQDNTVTISGEFGSTEESRSDGQTTGQQTQSQQTQDQQTQQTNRRYLHRELLRGRFERTITLPTDVNGDQAHAECHNGMLRLTLPKAESAKRKRIAIGSGQSQQPATTHS